MPTATLLLISTTAALIPTLFYVSIVYWVDRYEKEPAWLLAATFFWGAVPGVLLAFLLNSLLGLPLYLLTSNGPYADTAVAIFGAPLVEESVKGLALVAIFLFWRQEIDSPLDGIIYGAMVGLGFAMVENIYYFMSEYWLGGTAAWGINVFLRTVIFGLNHALFSSFTGLGIAVARLSPRLAVKFAAPVLGWGTAVFLHFMHNLTVATGGVLVCFSFVFDWGGICLILVIILWALLQEQNWIKHYLADEVTQNTLTVNQYRLACSGHQRMLFNLEMLLNKGWRANRRANHFFHRCSELAYKKHHHHLFSDKQSAAAITKLRREIHDLSQFLL
ncbi:MAG: PrsW family intramembrane metalloprotease [Chloroflexi bacterium]|nr:PrsW family intramembrane metalloprotease [Ardenticatenaceae bacterium]MBL1131323.1 protease PrsW [Chloroflexota bacterium]NOG37424.1 PrsW family intramembrane metalloprotease [Chloroflexota bacterium]GIK58660.1 MAG: protease PrsW [Chloroflexota bacterium]